LDEIDGPVHRKRLPEDAARAHGVGVRIREEGPVHGISHHESGHVRVHLGNHAERVAPATVQEHHVREKHGARGHGQKEIRFIQRFRAMHSDTGIVQHGGQEREVGPKAGEEHAVDLAVSRSRISLFGRAIEPVTHGGSFRIGLAGPAYNTSDSLAVRNNISSPKSLLDLAEA